jgi:hypothetical protein
MAETKKTAVEWFYDKIKSHFEHDGDLLESLTFTMAIAKQKEREQIENAYKDAVCAIYELEVCPEDEQEAASDYYLETFKTV